MTIEYSGGTTTDSTSTTNQQASPDSGAPPTAPDGSDVAKLRAELEREKAIRADIISQRDQYKKIARENESKAKLADKAEAERQAEQGNFQSLIDQYKGEIEQLSKQASRAEKADSYFAQRLKETAKQLPPELQTRIPEGIDTIDRLNIAEGFAQALNLNQTQEPPPDNVPGLPPSSAPAGNGRSDYLVTLYNSWGKMTPSEQDRAIYGLDKDGRAELRRMINRR